MSVRPAISTSRRALGRVRERGTLPQTGVTASTRRSGARRARKMALGSSTPGSVSRMMRWGLEGFELEAGGTVLFLREMGRGRVGSSVAVRVELMGGRGQ